MTRTYSFEKKLAHSLAFILTYVNLYIFLSHIYLICKYI